MGMTEEDRKAMKGSGRTTEPLTIRVRDAAQMIGVSVTEMYRILAAGRVRARKLGAITLIETASIRELLASLPVAEFRAGTMNRAA